MKLIIMNKERQPEVLTPSCATFGIANSPPGLAEVVGLGFWVLNGRF